MCGAIHAGLFLNGYSDREIRRQFARAQARTNRLLVVYGELAHVHRYTLVHAILGGWFSLNVRPLPSIALAEHALFECRRIRQASDVTGLTVAKIERGL